MNIFAKARPGALPVPTNRDISALTKPNVLDRWTEDASGIRAVAIGDNVITMFDVIGEDYWSGGGITAKTVTAQLRAIGDKPIEVQINSPGGDMFEGIAIYNVLREHSQPVTVKIMGMAASAASIVAMAGDTIEIGTASFIMIHNCWVMAIGNKADLAETAAFLEPFDQAMADVYATRTGQSVSDIVAWMDAETYMSGTVAVERGFADSMLAADQIKTDDKAKAADTHINEIRAMELQLVSAGLTRGEARSRINKIKGTPGAAVESPITPGADGQELIGSLAGLLNMFK